MPALDCLQVSVPKFPGWDEDHLFIQICPLIEEVDNKGLPDRGRIVVYIGEDRYGLIAGFDCPVTWKAHMGDNADIVFQWAKKMVNTEEFPILVEHLIDRDVPEVKAWTKSIEKIMCEVEPADPISREGFVRAL